MKTWYNINALASGAAADISIFDEIGTYGVTAKHFIADLKAIDAKEINLSINSPGGNVFDGIAIYNALRASGKKINVKVLGVAASIASVIAMAGDKITMPENTFMMVHNPWAFAAGNADEMRDMADVLDKIGASLVATYVARTGKTEDEVKVLLNEETYMSAQEALDNGFADEIEAALKVSASYDVDCLPENVRAAFNAAPNPAPANPANQESQEPAFADQVSALAAEAGLQEFATVWALGTDKIDVVKANIATAREIKALCILAKRPDDAAGYIRASKPLAEVRTELCAKLAEEDEGTHTDTTPKGKDTAPNTAGPVAVTTGGIWAKRHENTKQGARK